MNGERRFEYVWRDPVASPESMGAPPPVYDRSVRNGMIVERNVAVEMRDGVTIFADVIRPENEAPAAPIVAWTPYGKHDTGATYYPPSAEVPLDTISPFVTFEGPDPGYWVPRGYAVIHVDPRGTWHSHGDATFVSPEEAEDFYDLIEWAGVQPWSNGRVGLSGVSYLALSQFRVAQLAPPHLAAINPWEGWTDTFREVAFHGGIPDTWFWAEVLKHRWGTSSTRIEDIAAETKSHPFFDDLWASKTVDFSKIQTPAFVVAGWADQGMHLRGTLEGFKGIASRQKWLEIHGRKKWAHYYDPESVHRLQEFFDCFLLGKAAAPAGWPTVRLEVREKYLEGEFRAEDEWPLSRTRYTKLYMDAAAGAMSPSPVSGEAACSYDALGGGPGLHRAEFEIVFDEPTEIVGHSALKIYMSAEGADNMDVFVGLYKFGVDGTFVPMVYYNFFDDGPIALGWLRASRRELDEARTTEYQPFHKHERDLPLKEGEVTPLEIEIWPSGTSFRAGERLRVIVQGTDLQKYSKTTSRIFARHEESVNKGRHVIHTGGRYDSHLVVPIIPNR